MRYHLMPIRMGIIKKITNSKCWLRCGEKSTFCSADRDVNWYSHYEEQYGDSFKKLGIKLPYDPAVPLLGICVSECVSVCVRAHAKSLQLLCTIDFQAPLLTGFSSQEYWGGLHCLLQDIFPTQELNPCLLYQSRISHISCTGRQIIYH